MGYCIPITRKKCLFRKLAMLVCTYLCWASPAFGEVDPELINYLERSVSKDAIEQLLAGDDPHTIVISPTTTLSMLIERFQRGEAFEIVWQSVDGGGGLSSTGGDFSLSATIGQPDAAPTMTGLNFSLTPGFWAFATPEGPPEPEPCGIFCDGFESGDTSAWSSSN